MFSFVGKNKAVHALFLFLMSVMICAQLLVWGWLTENTLLKDAGKTDYGDSCYQITFGKPVSKDEFETVYSRLSFLQDKMTDVAACSKMTLKCKGGVVYNGSDRLSALLVAFYPSFSDSRRNEDLDRILTDPNAAIMSSTDLEALRMGGIVEKDGERFAFGSEKNRMDIYAGDYDQKLYDYQMPILTVGYDRFFSTTNVVSFISVQCGEPLSAKEISKIKAVVSGYSGAEVSCYGDMVPAVNILGGELGSIITFVELIAAICVAETVVLMIYVLSLRQREFDIYRMSGATETRIFRIAFFHMSVLVLMANLLGTALFFPARALLTSLSVTVGGNLAVFAAVLLSTDLLAALIFGVWFGASLIRRSRKSVWERIAG